VDRELYIPRSWTDHPDRCQTAGLEPDTAFATQPELTASMITRFLNAGHQAPLVAGDEVYGGNPKLHATLKERGTGYVLAVPRTHEVTDQAGKFRADALADKLPKRAWQKLSAGAGAKGQRFSDRAHIDLCRSLPSSHNRAGRDLRAVGEQRREAVPYEIRRLVDRLFGSGLVFKDAGGDHHSVPGVHPVVGHETGDSAE
jgi:SRSO17 transposase